jgi:hypothetical protein
MSSEDYNRKIETTRKALIVLKKDITYRDEMVLRNEPTYTLDAEINGQFVQIVPSPLSRTKSSKHSRLCTRTSRSKPRNSTSCSVNSTREDRPSMSTSKKRKS